MSFLFSSYEPVRDRRTDKTPFVQDREQLLVKAMIVNGDSHPPYVGCRFGRIKASENTGARGIAGYVNTSSFYE